MNSLYLPNCLHCSLATSALEILINNDTLLLANHLLDGYLYALYRDGVPVACFSLNEDGEPFYEQLKEGAFRGGEDYFTIHRFTSSVPGGGRRCLAAIKKRHHNIRTDTNENNPRMIALLEREGFQKVGLFHIPGCGGDFYAYEYLEDEARDKIPVEKVS